ncbi:MAG: chemotaxis protein CheW [Persicimonas sp.]
MSIDASIDVQRVLKQRAAKLASRERDRAERRVLEEVITVSRSQVRLGIAMDNAREVRRVQVTKVPGAPSAVEGLFQVRGECHSLYDLHASFFGRPKPLGHGDSALAVIVEVGERTLGLRIDEVLGPRTVYEDELQRDNDARKLDFVSHLTRDVLNIIDVERLFAQIASPGAGSHL